MGEMKNHPWTTFSALIALCGVAIMFPQFLHANEIVQRVASIEATQRQQIKETLGNRLGGLKSSLFDIQARIDEIKGRGETPDQIYSTELKRLNAEIDSVERQLADM